GREPREDAACLRAAKGEPRDERRCRRGSDAEAGERERVRGEVQRSEQVVEQRLHVAHQWCEEPPPTAVVRAETWRSGLRRALEQGRGSVVERVGERRRRLDPLD